MEALILSAFSFIILVLYVNIKISIDIARSDTSKFERKAYYLIVWLLPLLGTFLLLTLVPKEKLIGFSSRSSSSWFLVGSAASSDSGSGGDCG